MEQQFCASVQADEVCAHLLSSLCRTPRPHWLGLCHCVLSLPCKFQGWHTSSRSVRKTSSIFLGKDKVLYAGLSFQKFHTLSLNILFNQTNISCFKQQLQRTLKYLKTDKKYAHYMSLLLNLLIYINNVVLIMITKLLEIRKYLRP